MQKSRQFGLLTAHCVVYQASTATAGGFIGAYFLKIGFSFPVALAVYAVVLSMRFGLRLAVLPLVARIGLRAALVLGVVINAMQFLPLLHASSVAWLGLWVLVTSIAESLYWPVLHAASAVTGAGSSRGRDIARRQALGAVVAVVCPLLGGWTLTRFGPEADFRLAGVLFLVSALPITRMLRVAAGPVPRIRESFRSIDRVGMLAFAADGWMQSGLALAWPMILFSTLGRRYDAFGWSSAMAALVGAGAGMLCGKAIDRGQRGAYLRVVSLALVATCLLRACADLGPNVANLANALGAATMGLYTPTIMSVIYDRSHRSGAAYRFHVAAEAGWDMGAIGGCLAGAAAAWLSGSASLAMLPAILGIAVMHACVRAETAGPQIPFAAAPAGAA